MKKIYQYDGKCYEQQKLKDNLDTAVVSTPEEVTDVSPSFCITQTTVKNQVLGNYCVHSPTYLVLKLEQLSVVLNLHRAIKVVNILWNYLKKGI